MALLVQGTCMLVLSSGTQNELLKSVFELYSLLTALLSWR